MRKDVFKFIFRSIERKLKEIKETMYIFHTFGRQFSYLNKIFQLHRIFLDN